MSDDDRSEGTTVISPRTNRSTNSNAIQLDYSPTIKKPKVTAMQDFVQEKAEQIS
jgi:hypothetical protein